MRRLLSCGMLSFLGLCGIACVLVFVWALPNIRDQVQNEVGHAVSTQVARHIPTVAVGSIAPGRYEISASELQSSIAGELSGGRADVDDVIVRITSGVVELGFTARGQDVVYSGVPVVENGRLSFRNMDANVRVFEYLLPPDQLGDALADGINQFLSANDMLLNGVDLQSGAIVLDLVSAG